MIKAYHSCLAEYFKDNYATQKQYLVKPPSSIDIYTDIKNYGKLGSLKQLRTDNGESGTRNNKLPKFAPDAEAMSI